MPDQAVVIADHDGVDRAHRHRFRGQAIKMRHYGQLVRHRHVHTAHAHDGQRPHERAKLFGPHRKAAVIAVKAQLAEPEPVDQRRFRMADGPADHTGNGRFPHAASTPLTRR